jgi:hypothetical protein
LNSLNSFLVRTEVLKFSAIGGASELGVNFDGLSYRFDPLLFMRGIPVLLVEGDFFRH